MVVSVYGKKDSPFVQMVILALKEAKVPYNSIPVDITKGESKTPEYLSKHPFGQIPLLEDEDGFCVFESRVIARYIISKYAPESKLIPKGFKERTILEQAISFESCNFTPFAFNVYREKLIPRFSGLPVDEASLAEATEAFNEKLKGYEVILSKQKYIAGNTITLADLFHLPLGTLIMEMAGFEIPDRFPSVKRWWRDISSRPTWREVWEECSSEFLETIR